MNTTDIREQDQMQEPIDSAVIDDGRSPEEKIAALAAAAADMPPDALALCDAEDARIAEERAALGSSVDVAADPVKLAKLKELAARALDVNRARRAAELAATVREALRG